MQYVCNHELVLLRWSITTCPGNAPFVDYAKWFFLLQRWLPSQWSFMTQFFSLGFCVRGAEFIKVCCVCSVAVRLMRIADVIGRVKRRLFFCIKKEYRVSVSLFGCCFTPFCLARWFDVSKKLGVNLYIILRFLAAAHSAQQDCSMYPLLCSIHQHHHLVQSRKKTIRVGVPGCIVFYVEDCSHNFCAPLWIQEDSLKPFFVKTPSSLNRRTFFHSFLFKQIYEKGADAG